MSETTAIDTAVEAALPGERYRAIWHTDLTGDQAANRVRQQLRVWLAGKDEVDLAALDNGETRIGSSSVLLNVDSSSTDGSRSWRWQLRETGQPGLTWLTTITVHEPSRARLVERTWFWIEAQAIPRGNASAVATKVPRAVPPRLVRLLLDVVEAHDGPAVLRSRPEVLRAEDVGDLIDALCDPDRWLPMVVVSPHPRRDFVDWRDVATVATKRLTGIASVYLLDSGAAEAFNQSILTTHGVWGGALRTYLPDVDPASEMDASRHRVLSSARMIEDPHGSARLLAHLPQRLAANAPLPQALSGLRLNLPLAPEVASRPVPKLDESARGDSNELEALAGNLRAAEQLLEEAEAERIAQQDAIAELQARLNTVAFELSATAARLIEQEDRTRAYRARLIAEGRSREANEVIEAVRVAQPLTGFDDVYDRMAEFAKVELTCDLDAMLELDEQAERTVWAQVAWRALGALEDYSSALVRGEFAGPFIEWCRNPPPMCRFVEPGKVSRGETGQLKRNKSMARERMLPVPRAVDESCQVLMEEHIELGGAPSYPRMYFYNDSLRSGRIYVGYIGEHLKNFRSKSR